MRWFPPPPTRTAYFSRARNPGVVLRVSTMVAPVPATSRTKAAVSVATPLRRCNRLSATRSPCNRLAASPFSQASTSLRRTVWPSALNFSNDTPASSSSKTRQATSMPARTKSSLATSSARPTVPGATVAAVVTSPGPISSSRALRINRSTAGACINSRSFENNGGRSVPAGRHIRSRSFTAEQPMGPLAHLVEHQAGLPRIDQQQGGHCQIGEKAGQLRSVQSSAGESGKLLVHQRHADRPQMLAGDGLQQGQHLVPLLVNFFVRLSPQVGKLDGGQ